jgi:hypothetical protein
LTAGDDREAHFGHAKRAEVLSLIEKGTFRIVVQEETGDKHIMTKDGKEVLKARFVPGRDRDRDKKKPVCSSTTLKQSSVRLLWQPQPSWALRSFSLTLLH